MSLLDFYNTQDTTPFAKSDKGTTHDYIMGYYDKEFTPLKNKEFNFVEIGAAHGNSMKLWRDFFTKAQISIIENMQQTKQEDLDKISLIPNINLIVGNAYDFESINNFEDNSIDYLIDDGPHDLMSQKLCVGLYYPKIKIGGKIIIEDVKDTNLSSLESFVKSKNYKYKVIDLRPNKNRYDDIIIEITKT